MITNCFLCDNLEETRYIDLFVIGSEGLRVCHTCEMRLVEFARQMRSENFRKRFEESKLRMIARNSHYGK